MTGRREGRRAAADRGGEAVSHLVVPPVEAIDSGLSRLVKAIGTAAASTTAVSAILFYFGWSRAYYFYDYLGIDSSLVNLSTRDYLQLSVDGLFVPVTVAASGALALLWTQTRVSPWVAHHPQARSIAWAACLIGGILIGNGLSRIVVLTPLNRYLGAAPLSLAAGTLLLFGGIRLHRRNATEAIAASPWVTMTEWAAVLALVGLALFWLANDYSADVGRSRARQFVSELPSLPDIRMYSSQRLGLHAPGVRELRCAADDAAYRYRYDGLKLVLQSGDEYLFLPADWSPSDGVAILIHRDSKVRLESSPAGAAGPPSDSC